MIAAVIFDAFGTLLKIQGGRHPYRSLLKIGIEQGRRPRSDDALVLMSEPLETLTAAARRLGIKAGPSELAELEQVLAEEVAQIETFPDGLEAVALLQARGVRVAVCSNLASPYRAAVRRHYPTLDGYLFSCDFGQLKPSLDIYRAACAALDASPRETHMIGDCERFDCLGPAEIGITGYFLDRSNPAPRDYRELSGFARDLLRLKDRP